MRRAFFPLVFAATMVWAGPSMDSGNNSVKRSVDNAGGTTSSSANGSVVGSVGEEVAFTTAASAGNVVRAGWSEVHAFPRTVTDLGGTNIHVTSATLQWTTPGYDGGDGTLQVGSTYFIRVATYTVPDTFSNPSFANISVTTSGVIPGEVVSISLLGLQFNATYYARIWTTDGDSNTSYESNLSSFVMKPSPAPPPPAGGSIVATYASSATATWATSAGANSYLMIVSTEVGLVPVYASSSTAASTATVSGLEPNTTYFAAVSACDIFCSAFTAMGSTMTMAAPALSLSTTVVSSSTIGLAWNPNGNPANTRFVVRSSTDDVTFVSVATVTTASVLLSGLQNITSYYLEIISLNEAGTQSSPSNRITVLTPIGPVPFAPSGVAATAMLLGVSLRWDALGPDGVGVGLQFYRVSRSTNSGSGFVSVTTTTGLSFVDRPLTLGDTYYYRVTARDNGEVEGPSSGTVSAFPFNIAPMEPIGMTVVPTSTTVSFSWTRTTRFGDGTIFISTSAPLADELIGYAIYRSTDLCAPSYVNISSLPVVSTNIVDNTGGNNYYYRIQSYNSLSLSTSPIAISSLGERNYFIDDCVSRVVLDNAQANTLNATSNSIGNVRIDRRRIAEDVHDSVYQSAAWRALREDNTVLANYTLPNAVRIVLHFDTVNGAPYSPSSAIGPNSVSVKNLGMYWYNGGEFKKVYGTVDPVSQTVTVESPNLGNYQIRALVRAEGPAFDGTSISGRAITPNGDGLNDMAIFTYDPGPNNEVISGAIYDVMGQYVSEMRPGQVPNTLVWDGRSNGRVVGSGAYVYRLSGGGRTFTGTLVVAR